MSLAFATAIPSDLRELVALHTAVAARMSTIAGARAWKVPTDRVLLRSMQTTELVVAREQDALVATFRLDPARGFCGVARFTGVPRFDYLLEMAVHPAHVRRGLGRLCLEEAERRARARGAGAIRLDTNDDGAAAARFYVACGYVEVLHFADTRYFERLLR